MPFEQHLSDPDLWRRICEYEFPRNKQGQSFVQHLIQVSNWSEQDILTAIEAYRRFAYLHALQDHSLVAPPVVDRVWAHHRAWGESYEQEFLPLMGLDKWQPFTGSWRDRRWRAQSADLYYEREYGQRLPKMLFRRKKVWRPFAVIGFLVSPQLALHLLHLNEEWTDELYLMAVCAASIVGLLGEHDDIPLPNRKERDARGSIVAHLFGH